MTSKRIQLDDLLSDAPYTPHIDRVPIPEHDAPSGRELIAAAAKTAKEILKRNRVNNIEVTEDDAAQAATIFMQAMTSTQAVSLSQLTPHKPAVILELESYVKEYDHKVVAHADQIRMIVTNKLLEHSNHKDPRVSLRAVELLGKLADVGMFVDKQEITVKNTSDAELQKRLQEKLGLLIEGECTEEEVVMAEIDEAILGPGVEPLHPLPNITPERYAELLNLP